MSKETLKTKVAQLIDKAQNAGGGSGGYKKIKIPYDTENDMPIIYTTSIFQLDIFSYPLESILYLSETINLFDYSEIRNHNCLWGLFLYDTTAIDICNEHGINIDFDDYNAINGEDFNGCFSYMPITSVKNVNNIKATNITQMFNECSRLKTITNLKICGDEYNEYRSCFHNCTALETIELMQGETIDVSTKVAFPSYLDFKDCPLLTIDTLSNICDALVNPGGLTTKVIFGSENISKLTEEQIQALFDKNINIE